VGTVCGTVARTPAYVPVAFERIMFCCLVTLASVPSMQLLDWGADPTGDAVLIHDTSIPVPESLHCLRQRNDADQLPTVLSERVQFTRAEKLIHVPA
jgi:hypothetical protein